MGIEEITALPVVDLDEFYVEKWLTMCNRDEIQRIEEFEFVGKDMSQRMILDSNGRLLKI